MRVTGSRAPLTLKMKQRHEFKYESEYISYLYQLVQRYDSVLEDLSRNRGCLYIREYIEDKLQELRNG